MALRRVQHHAQLQVRRFVVTNRFRQRVSSVFVGARLDGLLAPPADMIKLLLETELDTHTQSVTHTYTYTHAQESTHM